MGAHRVEQHHDGLGNRTVITPGMKPRQQSQRIGYLMRDGIKLTAIDSMHRMQPSDLQRAIRANILTEGEQRLVAEGEQRTAEGRKHPELVIRPFDRDKRIAQRDDLLAVVERAAADQHVGNAPRLQTRAHRVG